MKKWKVLLLIAITVIAVVVLNWRYNIYQERKLTEVYEKNSHELLELALAQKDFLQEVEENPLRIEGGPIIIYGKGIYDSTTIEMSRTGGGLFRSSFAIQVSEKTGYQEKLVILERNYLAYSTLKGRYLETELSFYIEETHDGTVKKYVPSVYQFRKKLEAHCSLIRSNFTGVKS